MSKIVVFVTGRDPSRGKGGGSSYVRAHARAAQRAGFQPHLFCIAECNSVIETDFGMIHRVRTPVRPYWPFRVEPGQQPKRFFAHWLNSFIFTSHLVMAHLPFLAASIERFLLSQPVPHLIHGFYTWGCVGLSVRQRLLRRQINAIVINSVYTTAKHEARARVQGSHSTHSRYQQLIFRAEQSWINLLVTRWERRAYTQSDLVLLNYESVRQLFLDQYGAGAETRKLPYCSEIAFLRKGVTEKAAEPEALVTLQPRQAPLIVAVSRHDPRKGLDVLLRALAQVQAAGVPFRACLVSGGALLATHQQLAEQLRLGKNTILTGWVDDPYPYLRQADIFVLPSIQEGSGSVSLLEALQAGVAVVASTIDGIPEDVTAGESALLVEPGNVSALSAALQRVLTDTELRERLRRRARETFEERFSAEAFTSALGEVYAELGFDGRSSTVADPANQ